MATNKDMSRKKTAAPRERHPRLEQQVPDGVQGVPPESYSSMSIVKTKIGKSTLSDVINPIKHLN